MQLLKLQTTCCCSLCILRARLRTGNGYMFFLLGIYSTEYSTPPTGRRFQPRLWPVKAPPSKLENTLVSWGECILMNTVWDEMDMKGSRCVQQVWRDEHLVRGGTLCARYMEKLLKDENDFWFHSTQLLTWGPALNWSNYSACSEVSASVTKAWCWLDKSTNILAFSVSSNFL